MADKYLTDHFISSFIATRPDAPGRVANVVDRFDLKRGVVVMRALEAGEGVTIDVVDADSGIHPTPQKKIVIGIDKEALARYKKIYAYPLDGQTTFMLPDEILEVLAVTINGLETTHFSFNKPNLVFNPSTEGYELEQGDELIIFYRE